MCGAGYGERSEQRTNSRNGYRHRDFDTRAGTVDVAIPKLREGSYFPDWLLERRRRAERALTTVVATCYLLGVSTRRMEKLVDAAQHRPAARGPKPPNDDRLVDRVSLHGWRHAPQPTAALVDG